MVAWSRKKVILAAVAVLAFFGGCLKAGDGLGLDSSGKPVAQMDPCIANPGGPGCPPIDSCLLVPPPAGCAVDSCLALPRSPACSTKYCETHVTDAYCKPAVAKSSFAADVLPIIKVKCQTCHTKGGGAGYTTGKLNLQDDSAYTALVNVKVTDQLTAKNWVRVKPGFPDSSMIYLKITMAIPKTPGVDRPYGARMPLSPELPLTQSTIDIIKKWIADGAEK